MAYHIFAMRDTETIQPDLEKDLEVLHKNLVNEIEGIVSETSLIDELPDLAGFLSRSSR